MKNALFIGQNLESCDVHMSWKWKQKARSTLSGAGQNDQCMTSKYRESDKRTDGFKRLSRYFNIIHWPFYAAPLKVERA